MTAPLTNTQTRDLEALLHTYANPALLRSGASQTISKGKGIHVYDETGKPFIEAMSGLWCCGLGFDNAELVDAATQQLKTLPYYHLFSGKSHEPAVELAEKIKDKAPGNMARVMYQSSGSEANETQIKLAWYYNNAMGRPEKKKIISRVKGYHGVTIVSGSMTGLPYNHKDFDLPVDRILHGPTPHFWREGQEGEDEAAFCARMASELEALIEREGADTIAAFIAEPVMGAGGVIVPPMDYFPAIMPVLKAHDILCISDEVICGFGRTGNWFGSQTFGMEPTSLSMAKQLTAGFVPLSAVAINRDMADVIESNAEAIGVFGHGFTYGGHPLGCAVGLKALEIYERDDIPAKVAGLAPHFAAHLDRLASEHPLVGEARHGGLLGALELSPDKTPAMFEQPGKVGARAAAEMLKEGVILRAIVDSLAFCPPMISTEEDIDAIFAAVRPALDRTYDWARAEGHVR